MSKDTDDPSTFAGEARSLLKRSLPILRYAFAVECGLLALSILLILVLDRGHASYYVVLINIVILLLVLLPTGIILYFTDPPEENKGDGTS
ncbi:hypothetical protein [Salinarchaeum laminariae]|uniref:hypothetical protein n=1 Tax=Salinarchaeum laminariae TaxID=869888 RepID=UPI0020BE87EB|nr:hypothetical protein [Salinarchaeum laminariae]